MAKVAGIQNPYAVREEITNAPVYQMPNREHAAPSIDVENGTMDSPIGAWSPTLREAPHSTPDSMRIGRLASRVFRPEPSRPPQEFWERIDADDKSRHSVEFQDADGFEEFKGGSGKRAAPNPRATPPPEPRPLSRMAPRSYIFTRPMWGGPQALDGNHFSMADHRRDYPILGMQPVRQSRNTWRVMPTPWDAEMVDVPPNDPTDVPAMRIQSVELPFPEAARSGWRLD